MTDRDLLERAAKAAGLNYPLWSDKIRDRDSPHYGGPALHGNSPGGQVNSWNPLTDDGDAFRTSVVLKQAIRHFYSNVEVNGVQYPCDGASHDDRARATRLGITEQAAAAA